MPEGTIIKALSGFYYVKDREKQIQCRARGIFRKRKVTPLVGDHVTYEAKKPTDGYILSIGERKNSLNRPPISNVDQAILVFSVAEPAFDDQLLDRFLVHMEAHHIPPVICLTKWDLLNSQEENDIRRMIDVYQNIGYKIIVTSSKRKSGIDHLKDQLGGRISVITGQSGVGKSSLLNEIDESLHINTQAISQSLGRGRHTTRHVELLPLKGGGYVADTPGFSSLDFMELSLSELEKCFREFSAFSGSCRFRGCTHLAEPDCAIKHAVAEKKIEPRRYKHYQLFYHEINQRKRRY
ncbi:ribosome small subunit-dependent GTPase A [Sporolactobacillus sp. THM7-4]|nr:ribosome small subunit-dependent GTPase A [Sporolactobacillus sp. THM7-4]